MMKRYKHDYVITKYKECKHEENDWTVYSHNEGNTYFKEETM